MPIYNCENYLAEAIESILVQTLTDFEFIIIDDGSKDSSAKILEGYKDHRIKIEKKAHNIGLIACLNYGLSIAKGKYIARMDGDDIAHPERLKKQIDFLQINNDIIVCGTWYQLMNTNEVIKHPKHNDEIKLALFEYCAIGHPTVMLNSELIKKSSLTYNKDFEAAEDYELWCRLSFEGKFANLPEVLLYYRNHSNQISLKKQKLQYNNSLIIRKKLLEKCSGIISPINGYYSEMMIENITANNLQELKALLSWQNELIPLNKLSVNLYLWESYIYLKKIASFEGFYLNAVNYNMEMLKYFFKFNLNYRINLSLKNTIKIVIKCLVGWNKK